MYHWLAISIWSAISLTSYSYNPHKNICLPTYSWDISIIRRTSSWGEGLNETQAVEPIFTISYCCCKGSTWCFLLKTHFVFARALRLWLNYSTCWINRHFSWWGINLFLLKSLVSSKSSIFPTSTGHWLEKPMKSLHFNRVFFHFFSQSSRFLWHREVVPKKHRFSFVVPPCCSGDVLRLKPTDHLELKFAVPENVEAFNVATWAWRKMEDLYKGPQMWMSSLVLTIHNFGVPNFDPYPNMVYVGIQKPGLVNVYKKRMGKIQHFCIMGKSTRG